MPTASPESSCTSALRRRLTPILPKDHTFGIHHLSTPPSKSEALYSAPPNERPDRTYCESHFLCVSVDAPPDKPTSDSSPTRRPVLAFGVEVLIYATAHSTTLFVSKADSTGYLNLLKLPRGSSSPIRDVCGAFVQHLVETRRRKGVQLIVSLFARSQDQYLFPGSIKYSGKHVLDDRGLVKWWCRVLNPLIEVQSSDSGVQPWASVKGYLVIPGLDAYETRAFVPRGASSSSWSLNHPLEHISHYTREFDWVPPRCLIPRFPDDPKSRFRDELDEEADQSRAMKKTGSWKSVQTLDAFWEMMAFRQECSSGRMTGFIWVVFDDEQSTKEIDPRATASDAKLTTDNATASNASNQAAPNATPSTAPRKLSAAKNDSAKQSARTKSGKAQKKSKNPNTKLKGIIKPRMPRVKTEQRNYLLNRPTSTAYYSWTEEGRGERVFSESDYKRIVELLLHLEFATLDKAIGSTKRWLSEVGMGSRWGYQITGTKDLPTAQSNGAADGSATVNNLSTLVKRKRVESTGDAGTEALQSGGGGVNVLGAGLVKKKEKPEDQDANKDGSTVVNNLAAGLVRKKPKTGEDA